MKYHNALKKFISTPKKGGFKQKLLPKIMKWKNKVGLPIPNK